MRLWTVAVTALLVGCEPFVPSGEDGGAVDAGGQVPDAGRCGDDVTPADGVVVTSTGAVSGRLSGDVSEYLGVPYAQPPVGALRWRAPEPVACWAGVRPATTFGTVCTQLESDGGVSGGEDCLTLNVFAKRGVTGAPVLVWIHGGGNTQGSGSDALFDGQELASRQSVVVVTFNYRLGALGFFAHTGLNAESDAGVSGNYGLLDQQAVLRWVRDNARAFGGDPSRVMLFGESAGGQDTMLHLVLPGSKGLFHAAIAESGGTYSTTLAEGLTEYQPVVTVAGCGAAADQLACLRAANASTLAGLATAVGPLSKGMMKYTPLIDGVVLPANPVELVKQGRQHKVPVILGTNADETSRMVTPVTTDAEYQAAVRAQYGAALAQQVLVQYPSSRFSSPRAALVALTTDATWSCPIRRFARELEATQSEPVYRYFFSWRSPGPAGAAIGATHGLEVPFVFRSFGALGFTPDASAQALSESMQGYWATFAATGVPMGSVAWAPVMADGNAALELNGTIAPLANVRGGDCDFLDGLMP
jgi:para-nitrobenzyl esterase